MVEAIEIWECPVIFIDADPNPKRFDSIVVDYRRAVEEIVSYLVGCGHTKIGMIGCREVDKEGDEVLDTRIQHFQNALKNGDCITRNIQSLVLIMQNMDTNF